MFYSIHFFLITALLLMIAVFDLKYKKIPNRCVIMTAVLSLFNVIPGLVSSETTLLHMFAGVVAGAFVLLPAYILTGKSFGAGDVKIFMALGISMGAVHLIYCVGAAMAGAYVYYLARKKSADSNIAMAPFVLFSYILINGPGI